MKKNIGAQESNYRMIAGAVIVLYALFFVEAPTVKIILAVVAAVLAGTAFVRFCPINTLLKRNTSDSDMNTENEVLDEVQDENKSEETEEEASEKSGE